ncbi:unnamed protein product [Vitrella brassicaformis CCMP3155]|uniref:Uncharacterized protein n=1 Tax=Vitrella brassicaformis (strain CCMP3155) TaxID=1169540 RepID=A0A0G4FM95_VITBC|nr:unnamed protein product [Vitrella brassicaformis CCMP3155]|eukprot:CEM15110.1 unnamed protein product [Vitrella brassicaformis CCMP3155]
MPSPLHTQLDGVCAFVLDLHALSVKYVTSRKMVRLLLEDKYEPGAHIDVFDKERPSNEAPAGGRRVRIGERQLGAIAALFAKLADDGASAEEIAAAEEEPDAAAALPHPHGQSPPQ